MKNERIALLASAPIPEAVFKLSVPTILGMAVQVIYNLADTFFVGKLNDPDQVAAVAIAMPFFMMLMALGMVFAMGGSSYISRKLGEHDYNESKKASAVAVYTCAATALAVSLIVPRFADDILYISGASPDTFSFAYDYFLVIVRGAVFIMLNFSLGQILRSEGRAHDAMVGMFLGTAVNILLDPFFIIYLGMGVKGAAYATIIGNAAGLVYYFVKIVDPGSLISVAPYHFRPDRKIYAEIFKIGLPAALNSILMSCANILANNIAAGYGDPEVAAMGIVQRVFMVAVFFFLGLSQGIQPLIGYSYGAGNIGRLQETVKYSIRISFAAGAVLLAAAWFGADSVGRVFIDNREIVELTAVIMGAQMIVLPVLGIQFIMMSFFQAAGQGTQALILSISRQGLVYVPSLLILSSFYGFNGFIYAQPVAGIFTSIMGALLFVRFIGREKKLQESRI